MGLAERVSGALKDLLSGKSNFDPNNPLHVLLDDMVGQLSQHYDGKLSLAHDGFGSQIVKAAWTGKTPIIDADQIQGDYSIRVVDDIVHTSGLVKSYLEMTSSLRGQYQLIMDGDNFIVRFVPVRIK